MIGYIYQLHSAYTDDGVYVGSTNDFNHRKRQHKSSCHNENSLEYNYNLYKYIRDYGGWRNWLMLIVEEFEYNDKAELLEREQYWIKELKANLNNKDAVVDKDYDKKYYKKNKEKISENSKKYYGKKKEKFNCECGGKYANRNKARHIRTKKHQAYLQQRPGASS